MYIKLVGTSLSRSDKQENRLHGDNRGQTFVHGFSLSAGSSCPVLSAGFAKIQYAGSAVRFITQSSRNVRKRDLYIIADVLWAIGRNLL